MIQPNKHAKKKNPFTSITEKTLTDWFMAPKRNLLGKYNVKKENKGNLLRKYDIQK